MYVDVTRFSPHLQTLFAETKPIALRTDAAGAFAVQGVRGRDLYVRLVEKPGYEFSIQQNPLLFFAYSGQRQVFIPDETKPVIVHVRKRGKGTFLLQEKLVSFACDVKDSGCVKGYDVVNRDSVFDREEGTKADPPLTPHVEFVAMFDREKATWKVTFKPGSPGGGICPSQVLTYEAPEAGYAAEYTFEPPRERSLWKGCYLYVRSREPTIYSRLELTEVVVGADYAQVIVNVATNPYGDRNLEAEPDLPPELDLRLEKEAKAALRAKRLPPKPDLPKLIKEAKEQAEQEKGKR